MTSTRRYLKKGLALFLSGAMAFSFAPGAGVVAGQLGDAVAVAWAAELDSEFVNATALDVSTGAMANVKNEQVFKIVPTQSGTYEFTSSNNTGDPKAYLYDADADEIAHDDDGGDNENFKLEYALHAGTTYYLRAAHYSDGKGTYQLNAKLTKIMADNDISFATIVLDYDLSIHGEQYYSLDSGVAKTPSPTVTLNGEVLEAGTDYTIAVEGEDGGSYSQITQITKTGDYRLEIKGTSSKCSGEWYTWFTARKQHDLAYARISFKSGYRDSKGKVSTLATQLTSPSDALDVYVDGELIDTSQYTATWQRWYEVDDEDVFVAPDGKPGDYRLTLTGVGQYDGTSYRDNYDVVDGNSLGFAVIGLAHDCDYVDEDYGFVYYLRNGVARTPAPTITLNGTQLVAEDYNLKFYDDDDEDTRSEVTSFTKADRYYASIELTAEGKTKASGKGDFWFSVREPYKINDAWLYNEVSAFKVGELQSLPLRFETDALDDDLEEGKEYTVTYYGLNSAGTGYTEKLESLPTEPGRYQAKVVGIGRFEGEFDVPFTIAAENDLALAEVELFGWDSSFHVEFPASAEEPIPAPRVFLGGTELTAGTHYTVEYYAADAQTGNALGKCSEPGTYIVRIKAVESGGYSGYADRMVTLLDETDLANVEVEFENVANDGYGREVIALSKAKDLTFKAYINGKEVGNENFDVSWTRVTYSDDYEIRNEEKTDSLDAVGEYYIHLKAKGSTYKGEGPNGKYGALYVVADNDLSLATVTVDKDVFRVSEEPIAPVPTVVLNGKILNGPTDPNDKDVDYYYYYSDGDDDFASIKEPGRYYIHIFPAENSSYIGEAIYDYITVLDAYDLRSAEIEMDSAFVYEENMKPMPTRVSIDGQDLTEGTDYEFFRYEKDMSDSPAYSFEAGKTYWLTLRGIGEYSGYAYKSFQVVEPTDISLMNVKVNGTAYDLSDAWITSYTGTVPQLSVEVTDKSDTAISLTDPVWQIPREDGTWISGSSELWPAGGPVDSGLYYLLFKPADSNQNATGELRIPVSIEPASIADEKTAVTIDDTNLTYDGTEMRPTVTVTAELGGKTVTLTEGKDYTLGYSGNIAAGTDTAKVVIFGKDNFDGKIEKTFSIAAADLSSAKVAVDPQDYTGEAVKPTNLNVTLGDKKLAEGEDYTITAYGENVNAGDTAGSVTITGKGNYSGNATGTFKISAGDLSKAEVEPIANQTYTGNAIAPEPVVKVGGKTLVKGTDYTLSYSNNQDAGEATVTITGINNFAGSSTTAKFSINALELADSMVTLSQAEYTYDGTAKQPAVTVKPKADAATIEADGNYDVTYSANTTAGTAKVTVTGKGNYSGTVEKEFTIKPAALADGNVSLEIPTGGYIYDGTAKTPDVTVTATVNGTANTALAKDTDYTVAYTANTNAGTATVTVTGKGNYEGDVAKTFTIAKAQLAADMVELSSEDFAYRAGTVKYEPTVRVTLDGQELAADKYTVEYENATLSAAPTASVTAKAKVTLNADVANYTGSVEKPYTIRAATALNETDFDIDVAVPAGGYTYDGTAKQPAVTVTPKVAEGAEPAAALVQGADKDYIVEYANNVNAGTMRVKITGKGSYADTVEKSYSIAQLALSDASITATAPAQTYDGTAKTPAVTVKLGSKDLVEGTDFTVAYSGNTNAGNAKATLTAVEGGNFSGTREVTFVIDAKSLSGATVSLSPTNYTADGTAKTPAATVVLDGKTLTANTDYTVTYSNNTAAGTATATITGKGNYTGTKTATFTIAAGSGTGGAGTGGGTTPATPSAADQAAAKTVSDQIAALGTVTSLDKKTAVTAARTAYNKLTAAQQALVTNLSALTAAETAIANLEAAKAVTDKIAAIGTVKELKDKTRVEDARKAYDALTADQKKLVTAAQLKVLTDAEAKVAELQKAEDQKLAKAVADQIAALGTVTSLDSKAAVEAARKAYDALTDDQKKLVTAAQLKTLTDAEKIVGDLSAAKAVADQIAALGAVESLDSQAAVEAARAAYDKLTDDQKALVGNLDALEKAEKAVAAIAAALDQPAKGAEIAAGSGASKGTYEVEKPAKVNADGSVESEGTLVYQKVPSKKTKKVTVPATVKIGGVAYKVTGIATNAFKGSAATSITVGKNVASIGAKSLAGASKLKSLTLGAGVKKVAAKAFKSNKKLATITVKSKKLTAKSVKNALKGSKVKTVVVKVGSKAQNKKYVKKYKKLFTKKVAGKSVKVK